MFQPTRPPLLYKGGFWYTTGMTKQKKKRNKKYTGADAAVTRPVVTRMTAVHRNKLQLWWLDRRQLLKPILITTGVVVVVIWLAIELVRIISGGSA